MPTGAKILAVDQGTTSSRAIVFDVCGRALDVAQREFANHYPRPGWVEQDPEEIWATTLAVCREVLERAGPVAALGITNQRETTLIWDRATGAPIHRAIVWQDRRTAERCETLRALGREALVRAKTGLIFDPYFAGTKIAWLLDNVPDTRGRAERGELAFGTVDSYLVWQLTEGAVHATDATNASRTLLYDIHQQDWDEELLELLNVPRALLPEVKDCADSYGVASERVLGQSIPITGSAGDQQAATIGQCCFAPGSIKSTYGTGCFAVMNTGSTAVSSSHGLLTTVGYRINGRVTYALEGSIFIAGAAVQWLRDGLRIIDMAPETELLANSLGSNDGVYLVPAFVGLGAPHWDPHARGALFGITQDTGVAHLARAALESVCYQTRDLVVAMAADLGTPIEGLRVDGGMVSNGWMLQFLADILEMGVERPMVTETTALGAAYLAGLGAGLYQSFDDVSSQWQCDARYSPRLAGDERARLVAGWERALADTRRHGQG